MSGHLSRLPDETIRVRELTVYYGSIRALDRVSLTVMKGEVHAIVGEHGAGKSTLVKAISGAVVPTSGEIIFANKAFSFLTPSQAINLGIGTIYQHQRYNMKLSADEVIFRGRKNSYIFMPRKKKLNSMIEEVLKQVGLTDIDPSAKMHELRESQRQMVEIASVLFNKPCLLIFDEIGSRYTSTNLEKIYNILFQLRLANVSVLYISHRMDEVFELADRVSVLREGRIVGTEKVSGLNKMKLLQMTYPFVLKKESQTTSPMEVQHLIQFDSALLNQVPIGIALLDLSFKVITLNNAIARFTVFPHRECIGKNIYELFSFLRSEESYIEQNISGGNEVHLNRFSLFIKNNSYTVNLKVSPVMDSEQKILGSLLIIEDITGDLIMEKQLIRSEQMSVIGQMATGIAHEINNPLGIILNYIELMRMDIKDKKGLEMLSKIERETVRINKLVRNLLNLAIPEKTVFRHINICRVVQDTLELFIPRIKKLKIRLNAEIPSEEILVNGSEDELRQVFLNLIINAIDAMQSGGILSVFLRRNNSNRIEIVFRDNGSGFDIEVQKRIFEPFFTTKTEQHRAGLGLFIVKRIVEEHNGFISVESKPGHGSSFTIFLPVLDNTLLK